jgi:hemoglobin-like flavoprotein
MGITEEEIKLVQSSWKSVEELDTDVPALFYKKLFEIGGDDIKDLFKNSDMEKQGKALIKMIGVAVANLKNTETLVDTLKKLGKRHVKYGVKAKHYSKVGEALIWVLGAGLGDKFTEDVKKAWVNVYGVIETVMQQE